jgi:ribulose-5-phosphate 4-epimerase/fuculose-1-phosphate aldolase
MPLAEPNPAILEDLVTGNQILYRYKVVDAFGHLSVRHDKDPTKYLMSRHLPPGLVTPADILAFDFDSNPVVDIGKRYYSERFIHGEIYRIRPDVKAIVHCHTPELIPFAATRTTLKPIYHMSAFLAGGTAQFDIRNKAGMTDMLVRTPELGKDLAEALDDKPIVLMRGHGATIVGDSIRQVVHRAMYAMQNAALQVEAMRLGEPIYLADEEADLVQQYNERSQDRAWAQWKAEVEGD